jgi:hypothetical protein
LVRIDARLRRCPQCNLEAVGRSIGRVLGKHPAAAAILDATVIADERGRAAALTITSDIERGQQAALRKGAYLLRTNCEETNPALLWRWYIQLTQAESAFRTAKSDLGLRPIYHQKTDRVKAHILVCFLGLALWRCLEQWMAAKGMGTCARTLVKAIATIKSMDVNPSRQRTSFASPAPRRQTRKWRHPTLGPSRITAAATPQVDRKCSAENGGLKSVNHYQSIIGLFELRNLG